MMGGLTEDSIKTPRDLMNGQEHLSTVNWLLSDYVTGCLGDYIISKGFKKNKMY